MNIKNSDAQKMLEMRMNGATYDEIGEAFGGISRQTVYARIKSYTERLLGTIRGKGFDIRRIVYKGVYEYFRKNPNISLSGFVTEVWGDESGSRIQKMRTLLLGEQETRLSILQIKKICDTIGEPFETVFEIREVDINEEDNSEEDSLQ